MLSVQAYLQFTSILQYLSHDLTQSDYDHALILTPLPHHSGVPGFPAGLSALPHHAAAAAQGMRMPGMYMQSGSSVILVSNLTPEVRIQ